MPIRRFEDIIAWQKSQDLSVSIYKNFRTSKDFGFRDQITKASVSVSSNIAEGFERSSNNGFVRFLYYSLASNSEVRSMLYLSIKLNYLEKEVAFSLIDNSNEKSKMLYGLIQSMTNP